MNSYEWLTHPMVPGVMLTRIMKMSPEEERLLQNVEKAIWSCDADINTTRQKDACIPTLLNGIDAAAKLRASLAGTTSLNNQEAFVAFLETAIPTANMSGTVLTLFSSRNKKEINISISQLIYQIRCIVVHENENLDEAEGVTHMVRLRWEAHSGDFICLCEPTDYVVVNALTLMRRLREILSLFVSGLKSMKTASETGKVSFSINLELGKPPD
jgi:hypothetical protein